MNNIRTKKIRQTFTIAENVFQQFAALVPEGSRSNVVSTLLAAETCRREKELTKACIAVNKNAALKAVESDFQALEDTVNEPFDPRDW